MQIIPKSKFWDLDFFIPDIGVTNTIKKIIIFVNSISKSIDMANFLRFLLLVKLKEKAH